jgi:hypothetical protein
VSNEEKEILINGIFSASALIENICTIEKYFDTISLRHDYKEERLNKLKEITSKIEDYLSSSVGQDRPSLSFLK